MTAHHLSIERLEDWNREDWDRYVTNHPHGTIYHQSSWLSLIEDIFGYSQCGLVAVSNGKIVGGLPLFSVKGFTGSTLMSSPFRDRGGLLVNTDGDLHEETSLFLLKTCRNLAHLGKNGILIKQGLAASKTSLKDTGFQEHGYWVTTRLDLTCGPGTLWQQVKNSAQGKVRRARKQGVIVRSGKTALDMDSFAALFDSTRHRLGIPTFPHLFFTLIWERLCQNGSAKLLLAESKGRLVGGIILLMSHDTVIDAYAASDSRLQKYRANDLLIWEAINWASSKGYRIFDFGGDSPTQKGLLAFKRKWGGQHETLSSYHFSPNSAYISIADSSDRRYAIARQIMSALPAPLYRFISASIVSKLG